MSILIGNSFGQIYMKFLFDRIQNSKLFPIIFKISVSVIHFMQIFLDLFFKLFAYFQLVF